LEELWVIILRLISGRYIPNPNPKGNPNPIVTLTLPNDVFCRRQVRDVAMSKRGQAHKVEERYLTRCNQYGLSPVEKAGRLNLRTMSASTKQRLEKRVEERHGWELSRCREEVKELTEQLEEEQYGHMLAKEAVVLRAKTQKKKDKEAFQLASMANDKLNVLVEAALQSNKQVERRLRNESKQADKALARVEQLEQALAEIRTELNAKSKELEATLARKKEAVKEVRYLRSKAENLESEMATLVSENKAYEEKVHSMGELKRQSNIDIWNQQKVEKHRDKLQKELQQLEQVRLSSAFF